MATRRAALGLLAATTLDKLPDFGVHFEDGTPFRIRSIIDMTPSNPSIAAGGSLVRHRGYVFGALGCLLVLFLGFVFVEMRVPPLDPVASAKRQDKAEKAGRLLPFGGPLFAQFYVGAKAMAVRGNAYRPLEALGLDKEPRFAILSPGALPTFHPPLTLTLYLPFSALSFEAACQANVCLQAFLLMVGGYLWGHILAPKTPAAGWFGAAVWLAWFPTWRLLAVGQISAWPFFAVTLCLFGLMQRRDWICAIGLALTLVKPHIAMLPAVFLFATILGQRRWGIVWRSAAIVGFWVAATTAWYPSCWTDFLARLQEGRPHESYMTGTLSSRGLMVYGEAFRRVSFWILPLAGIVTTGLGWWMASRPGLPIRTALVMTASLSLLPYAFDYDFGFSLPLLIAVGIGFGFLRVGPLRSMVAIIGLLLLDLAYVTTLPSVDNDSRYWWMTWGAWMILWSIAPLGGFADQVAGEPADPGDPGGIPTSAAAE